MPKYDGFASQPDGAAVVAQSPSPSQTKPPFTPKPKPEPPFCPVPTKPNTPPMC
jgi:hypothetical protein